MGLRARLTVIITMGLGVSFVASLVLLIRTEQRAEYREAAERAGALLHTLSVPVALLITQGRVPDLDNLMSELDLRKEALDISELILVDTQGLILTHSDPDRYGTQTTSDPFLSRAIRSPVPIVERRDGFPRRVAVPVQTGIRWGTLVGTLSEPAVAGRLKTTQVRLVAIALAVSALGLITLLLALGRWVVGPIRKVSDAARAYAQGDLGARAPVTGGDEIATLAKVINQGADRAEGQRAELEKAVHERTVELAEKNAELEEMNQRLEKLADTDGLTGLYNHRRFHQLVHSEIERQKRARRPFAIIMADVDHFKHYNDTHGHPAGDEILKEIASLLQHNVRKADIVARYGGEEFVLMLLETSVKDAFQRAESVRQAIADHTFLHAEDQPLGRISVSMGVAVWPDDGVTEKDLVAAADAALYRSKRAGRNCVTEAAHGKRDDG